MPIPQINVWASLDNEHALERIAKQAREVADSADRQKRLASELKVKAQKGDRAAERALAVLNDSAYEAYAEAVLESQS